MSEVSKEDELQRTEMASLVMPRVLELIPKEIVSQAIQEYWFLDPSKNKELIDMFTQDVLRGMGNLVFWPKAVW